MSRALLAVDGMSVAFGPLDASVTAVREATFEVGRGRMVGLVGESGSGKTATGLALLGLHPPRTTVVTGSAVFDGVELVGRTEAEFDRLRGARLGMIFQDPMVALNPLLTIGTQVTETLRAHQGLGRAAARARAMEIFGEVGLPPTKATCGKYPHQLSGGQRQRAMIATAIACRPQLLIADEPTTALDVTIQKQILDLLRWLCDEEQIAVLLITHDLGVVSQVCDDVVAMYAGEVVESGPVGAVIGAPEHPYTARLLAARPEIDVWGRRLEPIPGNVPAPSDSPAGCLFAPRCHEATEICSGPQRLTALTEERRVRCVRAARRELTLGLAAS